MPCIDKNASPLRSPDAVYRLVAGEAVIVEPRNGLVNVLNEVGSRIWELSDGTRTLTDIVATLADEFEAPLNDLQTDAISFLADLADKQLVSFRPPQS